MDTDTQCDRVYQKDRRYIPINAKKQKTSYRNNNIETRQKYIIY